MIHTFLISSIVKFFHCLSMNIFIKKQFTFDHGVVETMTFSSSAIHFALYFSVLIPIFINYYAFYFIVKENFYSNENILNSTRIINITNEEIITNEKKDLERRKSNRDLDNFLKALK